jgi:hypothetical protein
MIEPRRSDTDGCSPAPAAPAKRPERPLLVSPDYPAYVRLGLVTAYASENDGWTAGGKENEA